MMRPSLTVLVAAIAGFSLVLVAGCDSKSKEKPKASNGGGANGGSVIPAAYFVEKEPANSKGVKEVKKSAKAGDEVVLHARIAGSEDPFVGGRAQFTVTDLELPTCKKDECKTPWDHCCEPANEIAANAATVQLVGEDGKVIKAEANGSHGLAPNVEVYVVGKIASLDDKGNLVVSAKQVFVKKA